MGAENSYLKKTVPLLYRKSILDVAIYTWVKAQKKLIPSLSINECAKGFMSEHDISEDDLSHEAVMKSFKRTQKELFDEQKNHFGKGPYYLD